MVSLWGKIADWFLGTKVEAAKVALFRLAHADTLAQQLTSFSELKRYVAPARQDLLTWQISDNDPPVFQIGDFEILCHAVTENTMANLPPFDLDDRARLLCSMHYDGQNVVSEYHYFAAQSLAFTERTPDAVRAAQERFLSLNPNLLRAVKLIGLDQNDVKGDFARDMSLTVERMVSQMTEDEDTTVRAARNAESLSIFATNSKRVPDPSMSHSDVALDPALLESTRAAIRFVRESSARADAILQTLTERIKVGQLREANSVYAVFAERYPGNARRVAGIVPIKVFHHYWMGHLDYDHLGDQRVTTWQTQNPKWEDDGVKALLGGTLDTWAEQALTEIRRTAV
ncbi:hypothetical protein PHO31112_04930 [Pandoraea horticolens]|uniref:Uncharacterized protein n=1 Tax=Pandoraea horticolens TaxID=2508298 RepID=A0A5E4YZX8_9BURK|nr:hypothetical protein PHO31112_04930 [Pandoraea horticolens]